MLLFGAMSFRPLHDNHAIHEVAFAVVFERLLSHGDLQSFQKHGKRHWEKDLPRTLGRIDIPVGDDGVVRPTGFPLEASLLRGVSFQRIRPDGTPEWGLRAENQSLIVNCMAYTRWTPVWKRVRAWLQGGVKVLNAPVSGFSLEYVDHFIWEGGEDDYDCQKLFSPENPYVPAAVLGKGPVWHAHAGWFAEEGLPYPGRRLEAINIDAVRNSAGFLLTKVHVHLHQTFSKNVENRPGIFGRKGQKKPALIDLCMDRLHFRNKEIMKTLLRHDVADRISLSED